MKPCRITFFAFIFGGIPKGKENGYDDGDLENAIDYCKSLRDEGFVREPHDGFILNEFISWAHKSISPTLNPGG